MIYLITGVPGSGKSLYAVSTLLQKLLKEQIRTKEGEVIQRRLCVDGIPDLVIPHELMAKRQDESLAVISKARGEDTPVDEGHGVWNWFSWCKRGDVIVCDEVQQHWRPRGMGVKPPLEISMLEMHRHLGVDFVLVTQHAMLLDKNVRLLVGRHIHVRRIFGGARALLYDWDGCQADTTRTQGATRSMWSYPRNAYKLYKSSELHTKQHQKIPWWFAFPLLVLALGAFAGPKAYEAMSRSMSGKSLQSAPGAASPASGVVGSTGQSARAVAPVAAASGPGMPASGAVVAKAQLLGCIAFQGRCECFAESGAPVPTEPKACHDGATKVTFLLPAKGGGKESPPVVSAAEAKRSEDRYNDAMGGLHW
jgi:zona occludens toxin